MAHLMILPQPYWYTKVQENETIQGPMIQGARTEVVFYWSFLLLSTLWSEAPNSEVHMTVLYIDTWIIPIHRGGEGLWIIRIKIKLKIIWIIDCHTLV